MSLTYEVIKFACHTGVGACLSGVSYYHRMYKLNIFRRHAVVELLW